MVSLRAREVGIKGNLRYLETQPYKYCKKGVIDAALIAQVDAFRPLAEASDAPAEPEAPPIVEIAGISSVFVPSETRQGGTCVGPFVDIVVTLKNRGGVFPRPVDMEARLARMPDAGAAPFFTIVLDFDFGNGNTGHQQIAVMKGDLPNGQFPAGGQIGVPLHMAIASGQMQAEVKAHAEAPFLLTLTDGDDTTPVYATALAIPIWDIYTQTTQTISTPQTSGKNKGRFETGVKATIINRGTSPTPGPVQGYFTVRHETGGASLASIEGTTQGPIAPGGSADIYGFKMVAAKVESPIVVDALIFPLCPDGTAGTLVDGNEGDNNRTLKER